MPRVLPQYRRLLRRTLIALAAGAGAVAGCYFFVDRPVALFVHRHGAARFEAARWLTEPPPLAQVWSPLVIAALAVSRAYRPWRPWQLLLFTACVSLIVADQFRESLGDLCGRYWPETWRHDNPSLIGSGAYGFHPFQVGDDVGSFPSGHAARISAFAGVWWISMPKARLWCAVISIPLLVSLVLMNYHFVGDVIGGVVLGAVIAAWASWPQAGGCAAPTA